MTLDYASIGLRIKHARTKMGVTQEKLAEIVSSSREHISRIETGERGISLELLVEISKSLNTPISELLLDNLPDKGSAAGYEFDKLLLDCSEVEEQIITKTAKTLKAALSEFGV